MAIEKIKQSAELIDKVEQYLQDGLTANENFNEALDEGDLVEVRSLKNEEPYQYKASEVLYWVDRAAYLDEYDSWNGDQLRDKHQEAINFVYTSQQDSVFADLIALIRRKKVAPFIGAGISAAAGYPSWGNTLKELGGKLTNVDDAKIDELLASNQYLEAAQLIYEASAHQLKNHVKTTFRMHATIEADREQVPAVIKLLPRLCAGAMVTTNFDTLIEGWFKAKVLEEFDGILCGLQENHNFVSKLLKGERCLLKLHGDASQPESYIFTRDQYLQGYGSDGIDFTRQLPKSLRQIYISHSLLFLGCSLSQDKTMALFQHVKNENQFVIPEHFAMLALPEKNTPTGMEVDLEQKQRIEDSLYQIEIRPIWYPENDNHKMLIQLLNLAADAAEGRLVLRRPR